MPEREAGLDAAIVQPPVPRLAAWLFGGLLVGLTACSTPSPSLPAEASVLDGFPLGALVRIDGRVTMAPDNRTITIRFVGGLVLPVDDPCHTTYEGWARLIGHDLELAVIDVTPAPPPSRTAYACPAAGQERVVHVVLDAPFLGTTATDLSDGHMLEVERPEA